MQPRIVIIAVDVFFSVVPSLLGDEGLVGGDFEPEGIDKLVVFFEVGVIAQVEYDLVDVVYLGDNVPFWLMAEHNDRNIPYEVCTGLP